jgi:hypothetical protein
MHLERQALAFANKPVSFPLVDVGAPMIVEVIQKFRSLVIIVDEFSETKSMVPCQGIDGVPLETQKMLQKGHPRIG